MCFVFSWPDEVSIWGFTISCSAYLWDPRTISYVNLFISLLSSCSFPVVHSVWTFHVPTVRVFFAIFSFSVALILVDFPVANFSILPWWSSRERGPCFTGRRPRAGMCFYCLYWWLVSLVFFFFQTAASALLSVQRFTWNPDWRPAQDLRMRSCGRGLMYAEFCFLHSSYYGYRIPKQLRMNDLSRIITRVVIPRFELSNWWLRVGHVSTQPCCTVLSIERCNV